MLDPRQLQALDAVVETQSFERASRRLNLTQSAVSQRVRGLESQLGQPLVMRSSPISATAAGASVLRYYRQTRALHDALLDQLSTSAQGGPTRLAIAVNADSLASWLLQGFDRLFKRHTVSLDLFVDDQDRTIAMLREGKVVGSISSHDRALQSCDCVPLGIMRYIPAASPAFCRKYFDAGMTKEAMRRAPAIEFNSKDELQRIYLSSRFGLDRNEYAYHQVPSSEAFLQFLLRGHGWGMVPEIQGRAALQRGRLIPLDGGRDYLDVPLYWHVWNISTPLVRALTKALQEQAAIDLHPGRSESA